MTDWLDDPPVRRRRPLANAILIIAIAAAVPVGTLVLWWVIGVATVLVGW